MSGPLQTELRGALASGETLTVDMEYEQLSHLFRPHSPLWQQGGNSVAEMRVQQAGNDRVVPVVCYFERAKLRMDFQTLEGDRFMPALRELAEELARQGLRFRCSHLGGSLFGCDVYETGGFYESSFGPSEAGLEWGSSWDLVLAIAGAPEFQHFVAETAIAKLLPHMLKAFADGPVLYVRVKYGIQTPNAPRWPLHIRLPPGPGPAAPEQPVDGFATLPPGSHYQASFGDNAFVVGYVAVDCQEGRGGKQAAVPGSASVIECAAATSHSPFYSIADLAAADLGGEAISAGYLWKYRDSPVKFIAFERSTKAVLGLLFANHTRRSSALYLSALCSSASGVGTVLVRAFHDWLDRKVASGSPVTAIALDSVAAAIAFHERGGYQLRKTCEPGGAIEPSGLPRDIAAVEAVDRLLAISRAGLGPPECKIIDDAAWPPGEVSAQRRLAWNSDASCSDGLFPMLRCMDTRAHPAAADLFVRASPPFQAELERGLATGSPQVVEAEYAQVSQLFRLGSSLWKQGGSRMTCIRLQQTGEKGVVPLRCRRPSADQLRLTFETLEVSRCMFALHCFAKELRLREICFGCTQEGPGAFRIAVRTGFLPSKSLNSKAPDLVVLPGTVFSCRVVVAIDGMPKFHCSVAEIAIATLLPPLLSRVADGPVLDVHVMYGNAGPGVPVLLLRLLLPSLRSDRAPDEAPALLGAEESPHPSVPRGDRPLTRPRPKSRPETRSPSRERARQRRSSHFS